MIIKNFERRTLEGVTPNIKERSMASSQNRIRIFLYIIYYIFFFPTNFVLQKFIAQMQFRGSFIAW